MPAACVQPDAPWVPCVICGAPVKTCEREEPARDPDGLCGYDYTCPAHPDGCELPDEAGWVCSDDCYDRWDAATTTTPTGATP